MAADIDKHDQVKPLEGTLAGVDSSSWVSWAAYSVGFVLCGSAETQAKLDKLGWEAGVLIAAIAAFFVAILLIQRHMKFSLLANTYGTPNHLVTDGVFAYSRNPIYVAFFMPLMSLAVLSPAASAIAFVLYILAMNRWVVTREERVLTENFGAAYEAYKLRTRRWL